MIARGLAVLLVLLPAFGGDRGKKPSTMEAYIAEAEASMPPAPPPTPGSLYSAAAPLTTLGADFRARTMGDLLTVVVADRASAVARGSTNTARSGSASARIGALLGSFDPTGRLASLAELGGDQSLDGQGETTRETILRTSLSARVVHVLPNGNLVVEGVKTVVVNSEAQVVTVRGIVRPVDVTSTNTILSDRLAQLEVAVNGKGVVEDAIRRPHFLYRLLLGILPF
jgi:flagellar L-ring protein precursor FlgH